MSEERFAQNIADRLVVAGLVVTVPQLALLQRYYEVLQRWNRRVNLTALPLDDCAESTLDRLIVEPLLAARLVDDGPAVWFDLGSGGGSPAIPLKIVRPLLNLTMVEARERKSAFLREAVRTMELQQTRVLTSRVEDMAAGDAGLADLVSIRGVRIGPLFIEKTKRILKQNGRLLTFGWDADSLPGFTLVGSVSLPGGSCAALLQRN